MNAPERFLAACARKPVDRTPVWMMRQAGRYLPEYRALREKTDVLTLCKTPELAAQASLQPVDRFGMDACIIFSDILIPLEAMGLPVSFGDAGPHIERPVAQASDVASLRAPDPVETMPFVMDALRLARRALLDRAALIGFVGAPFTLACYAVDGGGSKTFPRTKALLYSQPRVFHELLSKIAGTVAALAEAQIAAGAQAVQVFDTWAGELEPQAFERCALPYQQTVIEKIRAAGALAILYVNGCAGIIELMAKAGADVLGIDWRLQLSQARAQTGGSLALQGNVDPAILLTTPALVTEAAFAALESAGPLGHILNLGHGIAPETPIACAQAFVDAPKAAKDAIA